MKDFKNILGSFKNMKKHILLLLIILLVFYFLSYYKVHEFTITSLFFFLLIFIESIICLLYYYNHKNELHKVALLIILLFGTTLIIINPVINFHDGEEHLVRAELTSEGILFPKFNEINLTYDAPNYVNDIENEKFNIFTNTSLTSTPIDMSPSTANFAFAQNPFYGYIAPAIGILLAKILNLTEIFTIWLGSLFNLLVYSCFVYIAIKKSPAMKMHLLLVACLPVAFFKGATLSIDGFVFGLSLLIVLTLL